MIPVMIHDSFYGTQPGNLKPAPGNPDASAGSGLAGSHAKYPAKTRNMKSGPVVKALTFGEFIEAVYVHYDKRTARGIVRLAIKAHLIEFLGPQRFVIS